MSFIVYVLNNNGQPLMPTKRHGKVRRLLKSGQAKVVNSCPFTIRLLYRTGNEIQPVTLGVDSGSKHIGLSATTDTEELYAGDVELRNDIVDKLSTRREFRRARRNRKARYRKARFSNRIASKREGWLAPSIRQKIESHLSTVERVHKILPISKIVVEVASFDVQKIKNPSISGKDYQEGEQIDFWNVREYVLFRDGHQCQCCKGKSKDVVLNVHHIESRKTGGNAPNNLITLCETCHKSYHEGKIKLPKTIKRGMSFRDAAFMGIMRWAFYCKLKEQYSNVNLTYGYITKKRRIENGLFKDHYIDARCISEHPCATPCDAVFYQKKVRCHNRQLHRATIQKGGVRKNNQAPKYVKGFKLFDVVKHKSKKYFVFGRRLSGFFDIRTLDGVKVNNGSLSYKKIDFICHNNGWLTERRKSHFSPT